MADVGAEEQAVISRTARSSRSVVTLAALGVLMTCTVLALIVVLWRDAPRDGSPLSQQFVALTIMLFGAVGGLVRFTRLLREAHRQSGARGGRVARRGAEPEIS
jgi:hypothetical protein